MASLRKRKRGGSLTFEIDFYVNRKRTTIPLGAKYTERTAKEMKGIVETLLHYKNNGVLVPDRRTTAWLESATPELREKLAKAGLIEIPPSHSLRELWDSFLEHKAKELKTGKIKESTYDLYDYIGKRFFLFFDPNELLEDLTKERMQRWKDHMLDEVAEATVACYIKEAKTCFNWAVAQGWIEKSPLDGVSPGEFINKKNARTITMDVYRRLLDACPCRDWRVIIALSRIGGLRGPSEFLNLRWQDVNWELDRFWVSSPKTEHHEGKEARWVPLFPELKEELEALFFDPASEGREFVVNRYRDASQNLRTTLEKIVLRAGLDTIPQPFRNLRRTRSNEVYREFGAYKESKWIGHSRKVREDHYLDITDDDFRDAARRTTPTAECPQPGKKSGKKTGDLDLPAFFPAGIDGKSLQGAEGEQTQKIGKP